MADNVILIELKNTKKTVGGQQSGICCFGYDLEMTKLQFKIGGIVFSVHLLCHHPCDQVLPTRECVKTTSL